MADRPGKGGSKANSFLASRRHPRERRGRSREHNRATSYGGASIRSRSAGAPRSTRARIQSMRRISVLSPIEDVDDESGEKNNVKTIPRSSLLQPDSATKINTRQNMLNINVKNEEDKNSRERKKRIASLNNRRSRHRTPSPHSHEKITTPPRRSKKKIVRAKSEHGAVSFNEASKDASSPKRKPEFCVNDSVESLKNMTLDSLVTIVRSLGADEAQCYSRNDFINCIIDIMHGSIGSNYFEEDATMYRCPICFEIHRSDTRKLECNHFIGESCYFDWGAKTKMKGCPLCRHPIEFSEETNQIFEPILLELQIICCPFHFDCKWTGKWKDLDQHLLNPPPPAKKRKGKKTAFGRRTRGRVKTNRTKSSPLNPKQLAEGRRASRKAQSRGATENFGFALEDL